MKNALSELAQQISVRLLKSWRDSPQGVYQGHKDKMFDGIG